MRNKIKSLIFSILAILLPYGLFGLSLYFLFYYHSNLFSSYQVPGGFYVLAVLSMIALNVGSTIISPIDLTITIVADIQTSNGPVEIVDYGGGNYSVLKRGDAGIGLIILKFIVNVLLTPFMLLYWIVIVVLIIFKKNFAEIYVGRIEQGKSIVGSIVMIVGFALSIIEFGCVKSRESKYNPEKMMITLNDLNLEYESYYKDHYVRKEYFYNISLSHPASDIKQIEFQDYLVFYGGQKIDRHTMYTYVLREGYDKSTYTLIGSFVNIYIDEKYEGYDYNRIDSDYYDFYDYINYSEIDKSKLEFHFTLRYVKVGSNEYSYINTGWKDVNCTINF